MYEKHENWANLATVIRKHFKIFETMGLRRDFFLQFSPFRHAKAAVIIHRHNFIVPNPDLSAQKFQH